MYIKNPNKLAGLQFTCFKDLEAVFGSWPILPGENPEAYVAIGQAIWDARPPQDFIQATRISDLAYLLWEGNRLRRMKVKLIDASKVEGAKSSSDALMASIVTKHSGARGRLEIKKPSNT
jgi:hypothetical protein